MKIISGIQTFAMQCCRFGSKWNSCTPNEQQIVTKNGRLRLIHHRHMFLAYTNSMRDQISVTLTFGVHGAIINYLRSSTCVALVCSHEQICRFPLGTFGDAIRLSSHVYARSLINLMHLNAINFNYISHNRKHCTRNIKIFPIAQATY